MGEHLNAVLAERLASQRLAGPPADTPLDAVRHLLAVQAQDLVGARLAVRARSRVSTAADVDRALDAGALVVSWLNRGTLHLVASEDYWWMHALMSPRQLTANSRRLRQEGMSPDAAERGVRVIEDALTTSGPSSREELRARLVDSGVVPGGQALVHLLLLASLQGLVVRGPLVGPGEQAFVLARDWLGPPPARPVSRDASVVELARRYLVGHGPAGPHDLARWAGISLREARAGLRALGGLLAERDDGLADLAGRPPPAQPVPRLLGAFEPLLLGWASREQVLGVHAPEVVSGGVFRPFALVAGRGVATWRLVRGRVEITPFATVAAADRSALERDARDVERFLEPRRRGTVTP